MANSNDSLIESFKQAGQGQVFQFFNELDANAQAKLVAQAKTIDLAEVNALVAEHVKGAHDSSLNLDGLEPAPYEALPVNGGDPAKWKAAWDAGSAALQAGRVAAFTVAGGQGTRLGYDGPKGTYPVTPVTDKTLFQVFAEKIARSGERFGVTIPWYILTSEINNDATVAAFESANFFGLEPESVHFIVQGLVPAVDYDGKILLAEKGKIAMTPDGHGGSLRALVRSGAVDAMQAQGIDIVSYFQVDNPIVQCIDPVFIGFHVLGQSELSSKMVPKAYALEKVGHFCVQNNKALVVEYSDMPDAMQQETTPEGGIRFNGGSVAIHVFDRDFIARAGGSGADSKLPFHRADKKIPYINEAGEVIRPDAPNGVKFEMFVFDALPLAKNPVIIEAARADDFSPVKNAEGVDSPQSCKEDQRRMFARWLKAAGVSVDTDETGLPAITFEISHRFAADEADFIAQWASLDPKPVIEDGVVIE
ncbi:UDPGP type 1 family protein [Coraliomargarita sp. SDUM461004]|uniref:UDPGP type 1 family protein n=1 Tax=Thalassobacterium sedimentorum TaxID=3041258 RepID=A0ABU1AF14_9BACT|nr:UDPGP type 1 family protein [Coraliomargarita sp. SDUM461004]MDQ8193318.1 UDPGP type 1 family protein [Coraliomargarita sp. SDUM461004]